jgi:holo-[acyl-carrier protein] synthase
MSNITSNNTTDGVATDGVATTGLETTGITTTGVGVDIVEINRVGDILNRAPQFAERNFSEQEQAYCNSKVNPAAHYAGFFAAKEAVLKALGTGFSGMRATDIEVEHDKRGRPVAILHGNARKLADALGIIEIHLSISRTHEVSVATAALVKESARPKEPDEEPDSMTKLMKKYKELKSMIDEFGDELSNVKNSVDDELADAKSSEDDEPSSAKDSEGDDVTT